MSSYQPQSNIAIHLQLMNQARTIAGLNATTSATAALRAELRRAGETQHLSTARDWARNQALFTMRRLTYGVTLAFGAAAVGVVGFGLKFNASMEQNMVAFTHFLGGADAATAYLERLYDLAATTPFTFEGLTAATKRLIAFGYSGEQAFRTMTDIGDAAAGLGVGQEGIDRMTLAFGQMRTNGRILGGELRQLSEVGINARKYLQAAFNLTPDQMANIGLLHIPAEKGIEAILQGLEAEFGGFAKKQSTTFTGLLSTIHDYAQKLFGTITKPLFERLSENYLPKMVALTKELSEAFESGGWDAMAKVFDDAVGAGGWLVIVWGRLSSIGHSLWIIWSKELWPAIVLTLKTVAPLLAVLWPLSYALKLMADHTTTFGFALKVLIVYLFWTRIGVILLGKSMLFSGRWIQAFRNWVQLSAYALRSLTAWSMAATYAQGGMGAKIFTNTGYFARMVRWIVITTRNFRILLVTTWANSAGMAWYSRVLLVARVALVRLATGLLIASRAMMLFLLTNPIGWAILIISTLVILYMKWDWFHDKVNMIFFWIKDHWKLLAAIMTGPFFVVAYIIYKFIDQIWGKIQWVYDKAKDLWGWVTDHIPFIGGDDKPMSATPMQFGRASDLAGTPTRTPQINQVKPQQFDTGSLNGLNGERTIQLHQTTQLDRKTIAESVAEYKVYKDARR